MARKENREERDSEFIDRLVHINRVAKVVKGGRRFGFAALVVVGDEKGRVGFGHGKAREVPEAVRKANDAAKRELIRVPLREGRTLHHDVRGRHGAGRVILRAAPPGTGIIAGGPMRAIFEALGMQDIVAKSIGSSNPYNMIYATFDALRHQLSPREVAVRRGKKISEVISRREGKATETQPEDKKAPTKKEPKEESKNQPKKQDVKKPAANKKASEKKDAKKQEEKKAAPKKAKAEASDSKAKKEKQES